MRNRNQAATLLRYKLISAAVASCFAADLALANPTGPAVANGQVSIIQNGNLLQITNSPSSIINWQSFSIGASEITRFLQQSNSSAVLNRVVTQNPSSILGALQSNGRVFLINPNGILFGAGAQIDVAGLVASSLKLSDADFLAGRMRFTDGLGAGSVVNQGNITTPASGNVYLVGPAVTNSGIITSPQGEVVLAAGNTVELVNPGTPNLRVEITAPDNQAVNLGQIIADSGRVGIYAGLINQSGLVQANTAVVTEDGRIVLKATNSATLSPGSTTTATGPLEIAAGSITIAGNAISGPQSISATGDITVMAGSSTSVSATGAQTIAAGGMLTLQGAAAGANSFARLGATGDQTITASGITLTGGGGDGNSAEIRQLDPLSSQSITVTDGGTLELQGGTGGSLNFARIRNEGVSQQVDFTSGGAIVISGGSGASSDFAHLRANAGSQTISGSPAITLTGGTGGVADAGNHAQIRAQDGLQTIFASDTTMTAGASGTSNSVIIAAPTQVITIDGDLTMTGGGSMSGASQGGAARIGAPGGAPTTNLTLSVSEDVMMTGGSLTTSSIGSSTLGGTAPSNVTMMVGGNVTLDPGAGGGARIGSGPASVVGGNIVVTAVEDITLNGAPGVNVGIRTTEAVALTANSVMQQPNAQIVAGTLATNTANGANLAGVNQVSAFNATNTMSSDILLNNTSPLLTVTGVSQVPSGAFMLTQNGDLAITGNVTSGPQTVTVGGGLIVESSAAGPAQLSATGGQTINAGFIEVTAQDNNSAGISNATSGDQVITVAGGGSSPGIDVQSLASGGSASIANNAPGATQTITVTDADHINVNGFGPNVTNVSAIIHAIPGTQTISITGSGANAINVGSAGALGGSNINARSQSITAGASGQSGSISIVGPAVNSHLAAISTNLGFPGAQTVSTSGALTVTGGNAPAQPFASGIRHNSSGPQTVTAASITLQGGLSGNGNSVQIRSASGDQTISASSIAMTGGSGTNNFAEIRQLGAAGSQSVDASIITITGGSGGAKNFARIRNDGTGAQTISGSPVITIVGGTGGLLDQGNFAQIRAVGAQDITAGPTTLTAGVSGFNNFAGIHSPDQDITVDGDLMLTGGGSSSGVTSGTDARIGGLGGDTPTPTNLMLAVDGNVTMNGGTVANAGSIIGNNFTGGQTTDITMSVDGNLTLNPGAVNNSGSRIGSPNTNIAGGEISITAGGAVTLPNSTVPGTRSVIRTLGSLTLDANNITVGGSLISGAQTITAAGDITVAAPNAVNAVVSATGPQTISAGGTLTVQGGMGTGLSARILGSAGQTINASSIAITGGSIGNSNFAQILQTGATGSQSVDASSITIIGGASGTSNFAHIRNDGAGAQTINVTGPLSLAGGSGGAPNQGNFAQIRAAGTQDITAGNTILAAGGAGFSNFASFISPDQDITIHGNLTLTGGSSASGPTDAGPARIGATNVSPGAPTNLDLTVDGDVTMTGGSVANAGAVIGSGIFGGQPTNITMNVTGDVTLNPGSNPDASPRIGSPSTNVAGGNISLTSTGGNIALNSAPGIGSSIRTLDDVTLNALAPGKGITEGSDSVIQADQLTTLSAAGANLGGANQVAVFNATNTTSGNVTFYNTSPLLTVTGISQVPGGALSLNQTGNLAFTGNVSSGPQTISATGGINLAAGGSSVGLKAFGPQSITTGGALNVQGGTANGASASITGFGPVNVTVGGDLSLMGGSGAFAYAQIFGGPVNVSAAGDISIAGGSGLGAFSWLLSSDHINLTAGGSLLLNAGSGFASFARVQTIHPKAVIHLHFPNVSSGGYFVNGVENATRSGMTGFFSGLRPAVLGDTLITTYGN